jgi:hypothetical protein
MKKHIFLLLIGLLAAGVAFTQPPQFDSTIVINQTFTEDAVIFPFDRTIVNGLAVSGTITLNSDTSLIRIILKDSLSVEYMVFESYPMIDTVWNFSINEECEESCFLDGFTPTSLLLYISDASVYVNEIRYYSIPVMNTLSLQLEAKQEKVNQKLNKLKEFISKEPLIWVADFTHLSDMFYYEKLRINSISLEMPGFEFYKKGVYAIKAPQNGANINYNYVSDFDWRNRHGANNPNSYYFDGDPDGGGWITPFNECQVGCFVDGVIDCSIESWECNDPNMEWKGTGLCWAFGPTAHVESMINLYLNKHVDINLSEQNLSSCVREFPWTHAWHTYEAYNYYRDDGVVDEQTFPFVADSIDCDIPPSNEKIFIDSYIFYDGFSGTGLTEEQVRQNVMMNGPVCVSWYWYPWGTQGHARQLVGWDVIEWEDIGSFTGVEIPPHPSAYADWIGVTYWIYKNNYGSRNENDGFYYEHHYQELPPKRVYVVPTNNYDFVYSAYNTFTSDSVVCVDNDGDGYFNWGIGPKPAHCPECPDEMDCDDNNPGLGPLDEFGFCSIIGTYNSGFETSLNYWKQVDYDDCDWVKYSGISFNRPHTGPIGTPDESTNYLIMYYGSCYHNNHAIIESPPIKLEDACKIEMTFAYHKWNYLWGNENMTSLAIDISYDDGQTWVDNYWRIHDDHGDEWHYVTIDLPSNISKLRFHGNFSDLYNQNDMALDDITITPIYGSDPIVIEGYVEWDGKHISCSDIIIQPNSSLTLLPGCELRMTENSKIIVKQTGDLLADSALISGIYGNMWQGIEVWGNPNSSNPLHQGRLDMKNDATIENAITSVKNHRYAGELTPPDYNQGGIISAVNTTFRNNNKTVDVRNYNYTSMVSFRDCDFIYDEDYFGMGDPGYFMEIRSMKGVSVTSCNFINNTGVDNKGSGIYSYRSQVDVKGKCISPSQPCSEWEDGTFENLLYGIYATDISGGHYIDIRNTTFDLCHRGLYISGMTNARITSNQFNTNATYKPLPLGGYGMYLNNSTGYWVEDNDYYHEGPTQVGIGIIVHNSGAVPNEIYNNRFTNLTMGVSAQENNGTPFTSGLQILCNDFISCAADILVPRPRQPNWGIAPSQGANSTDPVHMAGNLFHIPSPVPNGDFDDINNQGIFVNYYYPENTAFDDVRPVDYTWTTVLPIEINNSPIWTPETGCPSGIDTGGGGEDPRTLMAESQQKIDSTETLLTMLVDGGNTQDLQTEVAHSFPPEAMAIYTELIDKSPYLSDTVVSTAIGKENVLVDAMIRDVMVANPHSAKNEELLNKLDDRWTPLPEYMVEQILQGRNLISVKEKTESQLARFMLDKTRAMSRLERTYRSDTANMQVSLDSLAMLYATDHTPESKYRLAFLQLERGEALQGQATLNAIPVQFTLRHGQVDEHAKLVEYYSLLATFAGSAPDSAAVQALYDLSQQEPYHAAMYATNMLIALGEVQYEEPVIMPDYLKSARASGSQPGVDKIHKPQMLKVKPNPAKDFIIVEYELETGGNILIEITDISGKPVHSMQAINARDEVTVDTRNWTPGAHIVTLKLNGKPVESVKFTITQ